MLFMLRLLHIKVALRCREYRRNVLVVDVQGGALSAERVDQHLDTFPPL
jgi:hypothetical protein